MPELYPLLDTGLAVVWDMLLTTQFLALVMLTVWKLPTLVAVCFHIFFSAIEATYFSACAEKVPTGPLEPHHAPLCITASDICCCCLTPPPSPQTVLLPNSKTGFLH